MRKGRLGRSEREERRKEKREFKCQRNINMFGRISNININKKNKLAN